MSGWGGLPTTGLGVGLGGFLWVMVACGSEESGRCGPGLRHHWVLGGPTRRALFGRLERFGPKVKRPGLRLLGRAEWGFFSLCLFFPCPVRDEAMGTSPEEGV